MPEPLARILYPDQFKNTVDKLSKKGRPAGSEVSAPGDGESGAGGETKAVGRFKLAVNKKRLREMEKLAKR